LSCERPLHESVVELDPWACHWAKEDPWRYCYNSSRLNEPFGLAVEWILKQREVASQRAPEVAAIEANILVCNRARGRLLIELRKRKGASSENIFCNRGKNATTRQEKQQR